MTAAQTGRPPSFPGGEGDITTNDLFETLANDRREEVIRILDAEHHCELSDLSEQIAALENGLSVDALTGQQRKRVYVALYQCHLPKMNEQGIIVFDKDRGTISRGEHFQVATRVLDAAKEAKDPDAGLISRWLGGVFA